ncbi:MAG: hypothetical protein COA84_11120 [Robiginitomaculum sp.]|nr:MAG: hypothetical protein COA84_11120 [Robiginitomaculum sp.]
MAKATEIPTDLTLDIGGEVSPDDFVAAVRNFFGYVKEIAHGQEGDGTKIDWAVVVKEGSNLIGLEPSAHAPASRLSMIYEKARYGIDALASGDVQGSGLSERAVNHLNSLSEIAGRANNQSNYRVWIKRKAKPIGSGISKAIKQSWETDYYDHGTIEGRLEAIQDASGALKIRVQDFLYPKPISCVVPEKMIETVFASFRKRVEITGKIHYRRDGKPISIEATEIDILPEDDELPTASEVRGIFAA